MSITMVTTEQLAKRAEEFINRQDEPGDYECIIEFCEFVFPDLKGNRVRQEALSKLTAEEIAALGLDHKPVERKIPMDDVDDTAALLAHLNEYENVSAITEDIALAIKKLRSALRASQNDI